MTHNDYPWNAITAQELTAWHRARAKDKADMERALRILYVALLAAGAAAVIL